MLGMTGAAGGALLARLAALTVDLPGVGGGARDPVFVSRGESRCLI